MKTDRNGNQILDGKWHVDFTILQIEGVDVSVDKSLTTESVYVTYSRGDNKITCRFSIHENNAVKFGDQLNGNITSKEEIMFHLGMIKRIFIPSVKKSIGTKQIKKTQIQNYKESELTIGELYNLPAGTDISSHTGKIAKGSNYLITGTYVNEYEECRVDALGNSVKIGTFKYIFN